MDHKREPEDMKYLIQPRGPARGWVFRMMTPLELVGKPNPWNGTTFGKEIKKGLGTRRLVEARKLGPDSIEVEHCAKTTDEQFWDKAHAEHSMGYPMSDGSKENHDGGLFGAGQRNGLRSTTTKTDATGNRTSSSKTDCKRCDCRGTD